MRDAFGIPIVYVSHAVEEVARLADSVVVLDAGRVAAIGPPGEVLHGSVPREAGRFEVVSVIEGWTGPADEAYRLTPVDHPAGRIWLTGLIGPVGRGVRLVVRGTDVALARHRPEGLTIRTVLAGTVAAVRIGDGPLAEVEVRLEGGGALAAVVTRRAVDDLGLAPGSSVFALVKTVALDERPIAG